MLLDTSPVSITMLLTWLLYLVMSFNLKSLSPRMDAYHQALWKILGYVGLVLVIFEIWEIGIVIAYGYFYELISFYNKVGFWFWWMFVLNVFAPLVFFLSLWSRFNRNKNFRSLQLVLIIVIFWTRVIQGYDYNFSIIPGWYAIVDFISFPLTVLVSGTLIFWISRKNLKTSSI